WLFSLSITIIHTYTYDVNPFFIIFLKNLPSFRPIILVIGRDTFLLHLGLLPGHRTILHRIADFIGDGAVPGLSQVAAVNSHHYNSSFPSSSFFYSPPTCCRGLVLLISNLLTRQGQYL